MGNQAILLLPGGEDIKWDGGMEGDGSLVSRDQMMKRSLIFSALFLGAFLAHTSHADPTDAGSGPGPVEAVSETSLETSQESIATASPAFGEDPIRWAQAAGIIEAPLQRVLATVKDFGLYSSLYEDIKTSRIVKRLNPTTSIVYLVLKMPFPFDNLWAYLWIEELPLEGGGQQVRASLIKGNMKAFFASWRLVPVDEKGSSSVKLQVDIRLVPSFPFPAEGVNAKLLKAAKTILEGIQKPRTAGAAG